MALIVNEQRLDTQQNEFLRRLEQGEFSSQQVWIRGFPGSGKSVLLAYALKRIKKIDKNASVVVVVFTRSMIQMFKEAFREMQLSANIVTFYEFMKSRDHYDYILTDEVQDLVPSVLRAMRDRADHIIVAGDENQSIYERDPIFGEATVSPYEIQQILSSTSFSLNIIHRLSSYIISAINRFLPNLNIFSSRRDLTTSTTQIRLCEARNTTEEVKYIMQEGVKASNSGQSAAILLPTRNDIICFANTALRNEGKPEWQERLDKYGKVDFWALNSYLSSQGLKLKYVGNGVGEFNASDRKVVIMTYHSSKGLDFDNVFLPFMNSSLFIVPNETRSKILFMVAMTRSKNNLYITYCGYKHPYIDSFAIECNGIDIHDALASVNTIKTTSNNPFGI